VIFDFVRLETDAQATQVGSAFDGLEKLGQVSFRVSQKRLPQKAIRPVDPGCTAAGIKQLRNAKGREPGHTLWVKIYLDTYMPF
jgi:hypothetical protein